MARYILWRTTENHVLNEMGKELHETPIGRDYDPLVYCRYRRRDPRSSTSILIKRGFMALRKRLGRKVR